MSETQSTQNTQNIKNIYNGAVGHGFFHLGAIICSLILNKSIGWAMFHGIFGFWYLLYIWLGFGGGVYPIEERLRVALAQPTAPTEVQP